MTKSEKGTLLFLSLASGAVMSLLFHLLANIHFHNMIGSKQVFYQGFEEDDYLKTGLMFATMLAGMFFNQIFELLKAQKAAGKIRIHIGRLFLDSLTGISFWMAVVVSPIIFFGTYYLVDAIPENNTSYFYAFQNGFFWYNIFNNIDSRKTAIKLYD